MKVLVIAPHPDDETLGCGGTLFRHRHEGDELYWVIVTGIIFTRNWDCPIRKFGNCGCWCHRFRIGNAGKNERCIITSLTFSINYTIAHRMRQSNNRMVSCFTLQPLAILGADYSNLCCNIRSCGIYIF